MWLQQRILVNLSNSNARHWATESISNILQQNMRIVRFCGFMLRKWSQRLNMDHISAIVCGRIIFCSYLRQCKFQSLHRIMQHNFFYSYKCRRLLGHNAVNFWRRFTIMVHSAAGMRLILSAGYLDAWTIVRQNSEISYKWGSHDTHDDE